MKKQRTPAPWMIIIAGPNGSGKSTFYDMVFKDDPFLKDVSFINLDNMAKSMTNEGEDPNQYMLSAGKIIVDEIQEKFDKKQSFIYETTSSGKVHLRFMEEARKKGYRVATVFIGLASAGLSFCRVQQRVNSGGHNVPPDDIFRRYPKIIKNFPDMLKLSDIGAVFDNSERESPFKMIFMMDNRFINIFYKYPKWLEDTIKERKTSKEVVVMKNKSTVDTLKKEEILDIIDRATCLNLKKDTFPNMNVFRNESER